MPDSLGGGQNISLGHLLHVFLIGQQEVAGVTIALEHDRTIKDLAARIVAEHFRVQDRVLGLGQFHIRHFFGDHLVHFVQHRRSGLFAGLGLGHGETHEQTGIAEARTGAAAHAVGQALPAAHFTEQTRSETPAENAVGHLHAGVVRIIGPDALVTHEDRGLRQVVLVHDVDRAREGGHFRIGRQGLGRFFPARKSGLDLGDHFLAVEITDHDQVHPVGMKPVSVKVDHILMRNRGNGVVFGMPGHGMVRTEDGLHGLAPGNALGLVVAAADASLDLLLGQLDLVIGEDRVAQDICQQLQAQVRIFLHGRKIGATIGGTDPGFDRQTAGFDQFVDIVASASRRATRTHHRSGHAGQTDFVGGLVEAAHVDRRAQLDQGEFVVLGQIQDHPVVQFHPFVGRHHDFIQFRNLDFFPGLLGHGRRCDSHHGEDEHQEHKTRVPIHALHLVSFPDPAKRGRGSL